MMNISGFKKDKALVVFGADFPSKYLKKHKFNYVIADDRFKKNIESLGSKFIKLDALIGSENIYEATDFLEELSRLTLHNNVKFSKVVSYKGYDLWWLDYGNLYLYFCLPYTQYKGLLKYLRDFRKVYIYNPPHKNLFKCYFMNYGVDFKFVDKSNMKPKILPPLGILIQIIITIFSIPIIAFGKYSLLIYTGDILDKIKGYDLRKEFIYKELLRKELPFVELVRSLEPWKVVIKNALKRKRPVIYSEAMSFIGGLISDLLGKRRIAEKELGKDLFSNIKDLDVRFKYCVASWYLSSIPGNILAIKINRIIFRMIGIRAALIPVATERNFQSVLGCKLNNIKVVGILHGVSSRFVHHYDFMRGFTGKKLSVDEYGVWSKWWKDYYLKYSDIYESTQLYVSGPMRPFNFYEEQNSNIFVDQKYIKVLFVAEQVAAPQEVMPYINKLLNQDNFKITLKFRPYRDGFENWLLENESWVLRSDKITIARGNIHEMIKKSDVVVGSYSTGVLEAFLQLRIPLFFYTKKWGDYYDMGKAEETKCFFAKDPIDLVERINYARNIPEELLIKQRTKYFGDSYKNGSAWAVGRVEQVLKDAN